MQELMLEYGKLISLVMNIKRENTPEYLEYLSREINRHIEFFNKVNKEM